MTYRSKDMILSQKVRFSVLESESWTDSMLYDHLIKNKLLRFVDVFYPSNQAYNKTLRLESIVFEKDNKGSNTAVLVHGPVDYLVKLLTVSENSPIKAFFNYARFLYHFLLVFPSFISPFTFLQCLISRWDQVSAIQDVDAYDDSIKASILFVISEWRKIDFIKDFQDPYLLSCLDAFMERIENEERPELLKILQPKEYNCSSPRYNSDYPQPDSQGDITLVTDITPLELARQLCLISADILSKIERTEFLRGNWYLNGKEEKAKNVIEIIEHSNQITQWVTTEILKYCTVQGRCEAITLFIHTLQNLKEMNNYNTMIQILSGLHSSTITKLKNSWKLVTKRDRELFESLTQLMSNFGHYKNYHDILSNLDDTTPCIPLIPVICGDIFTINDTLPDQSTSYPGWVNWRKFDIIGSRISDIARFGHTKYHFVAVPEIQWVILNGFVFFNSLCFLLLTYPEKNGPVIMSVMKSPVY